MVDKLMEFKAVIHQNRLSIANASLNFFDAISDNVGFCRRNTM